MASKIHPIVDSNINANHFLNKIGTKFFLLYEPCDKQLQLLQNLFVTFNTPNGIIGQFLSDLWFHERVNNLKKYTFYIVGIRDSEDAKEKLERSVIQYNYSKKDNREVQFKHCLETDGVEYNTFSIFHLTGAMITTHIDSVISSAKPCNINNNMVKSNISIIDEDNLYKLSFTCVLKHNYQKNINDSLIYSNDSKLEMLISTPIFISL